MGWAKRSADRASRQEGSASRPACRRPLSPGAVPPCGCMGSCLPRTARLLTRSRERVQGFGEPIPWLTYRRRRSDAAGEVRRNRDRLRRETGSAGHPHAGDRPQVRRQREDRPPAAAGVQRHQPSELKRLRELGRENAPLKKPTAELRLDKEILQGVLRRSSRACTQAGAAPDILEDDRISERTARRLVLLHRPVFRCQAHGRHDRALRLWLKELAYARSLYGDCCPTPLPLGGEKDRSCTLESPVRLGARGRPVFEHPRSSALNVTALPRSGMTQHANLAAEGTALTGRGARCGAPALPGGAESWRKARSRCPRICARLWLCANDFGADLSRAIRRGLPQAGSMSGAS